MKLLGYFFILAISAFTFPLHAQQQGQYSQYMMNYFLINPAVAGINDAIECRVGYRQQWVGLSNSPRNYYASGHIPVNKMQDKRINRRRVHRPFHAMGAIFSGQQFGALSHNTGYLSYAYHLPVSVDYTLSMGAIVGINQYSVDPGKLHFADDIIDPAAGNVNNIKFDLGLGVWLYSDLVFVGLSSMQMLQNPLEFSQDIAGKGLLNRHFFLTGGVNLNVSYDFKIVPSILLKKTLTAFQMDINTKARYKDLLWAGLSYRRVDAMVLMAGVGIPLQPVPKGSSNHERGDADVARLEIGYSYDLVTSRLNNYSKGSHEFMLAVIIPIDLRVKNAGKFW